MEFYHWDSRYDSFIIIGMLWVLQICCHYPDDQGNQENPGVWLPWWKVFNCTLIYDINFEYMGPWLFTPHWIVTPFYINFLKSMALWEYIKNVMMFSTIISQIIFLESFDIGNTQKDISVYL